MPVLPDKNKFRKRYTVFLRHAAFYFCVIYDKRLLLCGLRYDNGQRHAVSDFFRPSGSAAFREKTIFFDVDDIDSRGFASLLRVPK